MTKSRKKTKQLAHNPQIFGSSSSQDKTLVKATIHGNAAYASSAGGVIDTNITMDPSAVGSTDWGDFSSTYDEFRVLGVRITVASVQSNNTALNTLVAFAFDNDSSGNPGSFSVVRQYSTCKLLPAIWTTKPISITWWRPTRGAETTIPWYDVATASSSPGSIPLYASGLTATTTYLALAVDFFCEFRGRR